MEVLNQLPIVLPPKQQQMIMDTNKKGGGSMILSKDVLNSYYKSQLLGFYINRVNAEYTTAGNIDRFDITSNTGGGSIDVSE